jgi:protein TonB
MAGDAAGVADMREGANRALAFAVLASLLLHGLALTALPSLRQLAVETARAPLPLEARLTQPAPAAAPVPIEEIRKPPPPAARTPVRRAAPKPVPAPLPVQPAAVVDAPPPAAATAPAPTPTAPAPLTRLEPVPAPPAAAAPPDTAAQDDYVARLNVAAARFKRYPRAAIDNGWEGEVVVLLTIGADGRIASLRVKAGSGYELLDRQALDMFRNAKPFVPVPRALQGREFEIELRAIYSLRDQGSG